MKKYQLLFIASILFINSCTKKEAVDDPAPIPNAYGTIKINGISKIINLVQCNKMVLDNPTWNVLWDKSNGFMSLNNLKPGSNQLLDFEKNITNINLKLDTYASVRLGNNTYFNTTGTVLLNGVGFKGSNIVFKDPDKGETVTITDFSCNCP